MSKGCLCDTKDELVERLEALRERYIEYLDQRASSFADISAEELRELDHFADELSEILTLLE
jgi:hypothetical protein